MKEWEEWKSSLEVFLLTRSKKIKTQEMKWAWLMHLGGSDLKDVHDNATPSPEETKPPMAPNAYEDAISRLDLHYSSTNNVNVDLSKFRQIKQEPEEKFDQFIIRLRQAATKCKYGELEDREIIHQISATAKLQKVRDKAYESKHSLQELIDYAHNQELVEEREENRKIDENKFMVAPIQTQETRLRPCTRCGSGKHGSDDSRCAAKDQVCLKCRKVGHFARVCRSGRKTFNRFDSKFSRSQASDREDNKTSWKSRVERNRKEVNAVENDYKFEFKNEIRRIASIEKKGNEIIEAEVGGIRIQFLIDSGSPINTVTTDIWEKIQQTKAKVWAIKSNCDREFNSYGSQSILKVLARFESVLIIPKADTKCVAEFFVIENARVCLISKSTGEQLEILRVGVDICSIGNNNENEAAFPTIPIPALHIHIDKTVTPVKNLHCRIPIAMQEKAIEKLRWMITSDIVEPVNEPAEWTSPLICVPKGQKDIRICIDMRQANKAIMRVNHLMPTMEMIRDKIRGCVIFSKLDITNAYHHILLDENSRHITTFMSPLGLLRYKRLMFGMNSAPEIYQKIMDEIFAGQEEVAIYLDDILIASKDNESHEIRIKTVLNLMK